MLNSKGERALAYIATIIDIVPIEGADNIELAKVNGWNVIVKKQEFSIDDKCVFFEIDSKLPEEEWSEFLRNKKFKVKTYKLSKFNVISQGLVLPISIDDRLAELDVNTDVTDLLNVTYAEAEDNIRKKSDPNAKYESMKARHEHIFKTRWAKWLMRHAWGRKLMFFFFGKKKDSPGGFPGFISKTDEERIENVPWRLNSNKKQWIVTEKLDGTSCTYALERKGKNKFEFYVCSRNVRQQNENQATYHDHNIYWDLAFKYDIENHLKKYLQTHKDLKWVCIQGEGVGNVQGNPLKLKEDDLYIFNFITSDIGRHSSFDGRSIVVKWGMKWVPIIGIETLPATMEEIKARTEGKSVVGNGVMREGLVFRSTDGKESFKSVSISYLLSRH